MNTKKLSTSAAAALVVAGGFVGLTALPAAAAMPATAATNCVATGGTWTQTAPASAAAPEQGVCAAAPTPSQVPVATPQPSAVKAPG